MKYFWLMLPLIAIAFIACKQFRYDRVEFILPLLLVLGVIGCKQDPLYRPFKRIDAPTAFPAHPRVFLNEQEIAELKAWIKRDAELREYVDGFIAKMLNAADSPELPTLDKSRNLEIARQANRFALAYVLSDDLRLAEAAAAILRKYVEVFPEYPADLFKGKATDAALTEVQWAAPACAAYDLIYNSGVLSDADKAAIERDVFKASGEVMRLCNHAYRSNWRIAASSGIGVIGFCIGDRDLIDESINGFRDETGKLVRDGFVNQMYWSVLCDGTYYERSGGYTNAVFIFYTWFLEAARHSGVDLWHTAFEGGGPYDFGVDKGKDFDRIEPKTFETYFDGYTRRMFGNAVMARVGNDGRGKPEAGFVWASAWRAYKDPRFAWVFHNILGKNSVADPLDLMFMPPDIPPGEFEFAKDAIVGQTGRHINSCTLLPNGGFVILRQSGDVDAAAVALTYGDYVNAHCHPDQLSMALYADGLIISPDPKNHSYGDEGHTGWEKHTIAHNTVTVDEVSQYPQGTSEDAWVCVTDPNKPVFGKLVLFHPGKELKAVRTTCDNAYDGVVLDRTAVLVDSVVVDFYRCRSSEQRTYDLALHVEAELTQSSVVLSEAEEKPLSDKVGYRYITGVRRAAMADAPARFDYAAKAGQSMQVTVLPDGAAELIAAKGYADKDGNRRSVLIVRKRGGDVNFASAKSFPAANVRGVSQLTGLPRGLMGVQIERAGGHTDIIVSAEKPGTYAVAGQKFTGQIALFRITDGSRAALVDAGK